MNSLAHATASLRVDSPVGPLVLLASADGLAGVYFGHRARFPLPPEAETAVLVDAARQLEEYFAGERTAFDLPLDACGTEFQRAVWRQLSAIPFGTTASYGEIARRIGNPKAVRAVGLANGANPISIIVPCHRVIGANGKLTGFGGGLEIKRALLELESPRLSLAV